VQHLERPQGLQKLANRSMPQLFDRALLSETPESYQQRSPPFCPRNLRLGENYCCAEWIDQINEWNAVGLTKAPRQSTICGGMSRSWVRKRVVSKR
jgi:hypothetical protein